jgi:cytochrome c553
MVSKLRFLGTILSTLMIVGCAADAEGVAERGADLFNNNCMVCHGFDAGGRSELAAPSLAGLDDWYVEAQLHKFQAGIRGAHPKDMPGMRMRPMSRTLENNDDIAAVADHIKYMRPQKGDVSVVGGDTARGKELYVTCAACHGPEGKGNKDLNSPPIGQMDDWYIMTQLHNFKVGIRGADPRDVTGMQMAPMAQGLVDEQAMKDVVSYIKTFEN